MGSRRLVTLQRGELLLHRWDVMHGVHVTAGERYSLVVWCAESEAALAAGDYPWVRRDTPASSMAPTTTFPLPRPCYCSTAVAPLRWPHYCHGDHACLLWQVRRAAVAGHPAAQFIQATFEYAGTFGASRNVTAAAEWWAH